ncbi:MAG: hypothetical protein HYZ57_15095 [Acidobacteria bacterium]|nr:hypothetical protein [Acidobacteriota bacterium]
MAHFLLRLCAAALVFVLAADAQQGQRRGQRRQGRAQQSPERAAQASLPPAQLAGEVAAERFSDPGKQGDWPAIAHARDGSLFAIWIEWNDRDADRVLVRRRDPAGAWGAPFELNDGNWDHYSPALAPHEDGVLAVWAGQKDGNYDLFASQIPANGQAARPQRLTTAPFSDFNVRAAAAPNGDVIIVWQSFRAGNSDIYARRLSGSRWGPEVRLSLSDANDWEPDVAIAPSGAAWISWDSYQNGNYDVFLRALDGATLGPVVPVTTGKTAQFHTSVAVDREGSAWVAWDDAGENWGKDFSRSSSAPGSRGLHFSRKLGLRVYATGRLQEPKADLARVLTGRMQRYAELPDLAFDASGALWLVFRHWTELKPHEIYHFYAARLSGGEWTLPWRLASSSGQNTQRASVALAPAGGLSVAYSSDGRSAATLPQDQMHALHYNSYVASLPRGSGPARTELAAVTLPSPGTREPRRPRHTMRAGGKQYTLMLGDCHRHTDIRGHSAVDGSVLDTYRYAIDAAQLDFLGTSDHNEVVGGRWPDGLRDYQWWWTQKVVDLMTHPPAFVGIYSYEHSMQRPAGHRNVLFLKRGAPLRPIDRERKPEDNQPPNMWKWWEANVLTQSGQKTVIVPHTFGAGPLADWKWPNARYDCLLEMYQGARGSYEAWRLPEKEKRGPTQTDEPGHFAQDALAAGNTYGFVSFSDHGSTHNSWAGVWVTKQDREGILDGMYERRTFAASDEIILKVTADDRMVGQEWEASASKPPVIRASVQAPDTILRVDVVKDGKYVFTTRPNAKSATLEFRDTDVKPGKSYYYLRVFQRDPENPEGDPEIGWASPFYVTYR